MQSFAQRDAAVAPGSTGDGALDLFSIIAVELAQVSAAIEEELSDCSQTVQRLVTGTIAVKGKMIRPAMVLLSGLACGRLTQKHIRAAAIVEMIHHATLLHDDVVDDGKSRRGVPTLNSLQGNESAVLLGDFVLSRVFRMCIGLGGRPAQMIASAAAQTCEGELRQIAKRGNWQLGEQEYIEIIAEKTAALFDGACVLGAMLAYAGKSQVKMLADYGRKLDLVGDQNKTGKSVGNDLDNHKLTLPLIHFLQVASERDKRQAKALLGGNSMGRAGKVEVKNKAMMIEKLTAYGSLTYAQHRAEELVEEAVSAIAKLKDSDAKHALIETARFVVRRTA
jgi:octaprenyl-diphosphate synthase